MAITRRTTMRKAFLGDWDERVSDIFLYALADAQRHTQVAIHDAVRCITHEHIDVTPSQPNLPEFLRRANGDLSCALNTLLIDRRYHAPRQLFDGRQAHAMRLLDAPAQMSQALYHHLNPVAAGLVADPRHMPGRSCDFRDWKRGVITVKRPDLYFGKDRPSELQLQVTPPPLLMRAFEGNLDALVYQLERLAKDNIRALRRAHGRAPMGAQRLRRLHPWNEPRTLAESGGQRVPTFKSGAGGLTGKWQRIAACKEVTGFRGSYRSSTKRYCDGDRTTAFPFGTYMMRKRFGVAVEEPAVDALVAQPGPTLDEVLRELQEAQGVQGALNDGHAGRQDQLLASRDVVQQVREAWTDEVTDLAEAQRVRFDPMGVHDMRKHEDTPADDSPAAAGQDDAPGDDDEAELVEVRHQRDRHPHPARAARIITLRDQRNGRPPKPSGKPPPR